MTHQDHAALGIKVINLLDSASYATTYKLATLLGLIDVIKESVASDGTLPTVIHGAAIGDKVFEFYWPQSVPYQSALTQSSAPLRQSPQRDIPFIIAEYRTKTSNLSRSASIESSESKDPAGMNQLRREVRNRILKMPIPRLQKLGNKDGWKEDRFLFEYNWEEDKIPKDDSLHLKDGVAESLMKIRPLLRPYIETLWANFVAEQNPKLTDASNLRNALFGKTRTNTKPLREPLRELQNNSCFYCCNTLPTGGDVDHFFAFTHFYNEDLDNFVLACSTCNNSKSATLPSLSHLSILLQRNSQSPQLDVLSAKLNWPRGTQKVAALASLAYLVESSASLWKAPGVFEDLDVVAAQELLT